MRDRERREWWQADMGSDRGQAMETECAFQEGPALVSVMAAAPKRLERMREKLAKCACPPPRPSTLFSVREGKDELNGA